MRERGRYPNTVYENTFSSGVGSKVDLKFDPDTLRIEDLEEGDDDAMTVVPGSSRSLKRGNSIKADEDEAKGTIDPSIEHA